MSDAKVAARLRQLIVSDYLHLYGGRAETSAEQILKGVRRFGIDPSLHAVVMMRLVCRGPRALAPVLIWMLQTKHGIVMTRECELGAGLIIPHPLSIVLGPETRIGANVRIYHNVSLGAPAWGGVRLGDGAVVHCNSTVAPGVSIGKGALIGANCTVTADVPDGGVFVRGVLRSPTFSERQ